MGKSHPPDPEAEPAEGERCPRCGGTRDEPGQVPPDTNPTYMTALRSRPCRALFHTPDPDPLPLAITGTREVEPGDADKLAVGESLPLDKRIISIVRMPDGRMAVANESDLSDLTVADYDEMGHTLALWFRTHYNVKGSAPPAERGPDG